LLRSRANRKTFDVPDAEVEEDLSAPGLSKIEQIYE
jgi:hypothetical protein